MSIISELCPISDFATKMRRGRLISGKIRKTEEKSGLKIGRALVRLLWRVAAPGLKPLRLPHARSPGMGEGGDWWSCLMGLVAKGIPRDCQDLITPVSLGYQLSVSNKNSTVKPNQTNKLLKT